MKEASLLSIGVSIVLYNPPLREIQQLIADLLEQGAAAIYLVDNSPLPFDTFGAWVPPPRVSIIRSGRNLGYGRGHNLAIHDSIPRHAYHLVSNPDISLGSQVLPRLYAEMERRPDVGLIMPQVVGPDGCRHYLCKRAPSPLNYIPRWMLAESRRRRARDYFEMRDHSYDEAFEAECLSGCFMFLRSTALQQVGAFDERFFMYFEDFDLSRRIRRVARNVYFPAATVVHEHRRGHRRSLRLLLIFGASAVRYFTKWGWFERSQSRAGVASASRRVG